MEKSSFDGDVEGARDDQASLQAIDVDTPTNNNIQGDENPIKKEIRMRITSSEELFNISIKSQVIQLFKTDDPKDIYPMEGLKGVVCILNIKDFENKEKERLGSEIDVKNIINLFEKLEYKIIEIKEVRKKDIVNKIIDIKKDVDLKEASNFIMFLMSHGIEGCLIDANDEKMSIEEMFLKPFSTCEPLFNKPKLFFIQACRGNEKHSNVEDGSCKKGIKNYMDFDEAIGINGNIVEQKNLADFFIFYSTFESYASMRLPNGIGSVFIRCLVLTISYFCHQHSLNTIMNYVKDIMKSLKIPYKGEALNQIASNDTNSLSKDVYFLPVVRIHPSYQDVTNMLMEEKKRSVQQENMLWGFQKLTEKELKLAQKLKYPFELEYDLSEIVGLDDIKKEIREKILEPLTNPDKQLPKGVLFHGSSMEENYDFVCATAKSAGLFLFDSYSSFEKNNDLKAAISMLRKIQPVIVRVHDNFESLEGIKRLLNQTTFEDKIIAMFGTRYIKNRGSDLLDLFPLKIEIPLPNEDRRIGRIKKELEKFRDKDRRIGIMKKELENFGISDDVDWDKLSNRFEGWDVRDLQSFCKDVSRRAKERSGDNVKMEDFDYVIKKWKELFHPNISFSGEDKKEWKITRIAARRRII